MERIRPVTIELDRIYERDGCEFSLRVKAVNPSEISTF
jgi:hypothetical protein